jgi:hypothetical protein
LRRLAKGKAAARKEQPATQQNGNLAHEKPSFRRGLEKPSRL